MHTTPVKFQIAMAVYQPPEKLEHTLAIASRADLSMSFHKQLLRLSLYEFQARMTCKGQSLNVGPKLNACNSLSPSIPFPMRATLGLLLI